MTKRDKIIYWIATVLFAAFMLMNVVVYSTQFEMVAEMFIGLGFPSEMIYPLAIAKFLGVIALFVRKWKTLTLLAYAGFAIDLVTAAAAHAITGHGEAYGPVIPLVLLVVSFIFYRRIS